MKKFLFLAAVSALIATACQHETVVSLEPDPCSTGLSYAVDIFPIVDASCNYTGCHDGAYDTYEGIEPKLFSGKLVDRVFHRMSDPVLRMPPGSIAYPNVQKEMLTQEELDLIQCWVNQGYPR